jgi:hypothetical protein
LPSGGVESGARYDYEGVGRWSGRQVIENPRNRFVHAHKALEGEAIDTSFAML